MPNIISFIKSDKFESDLVKTNEEIAPETREIVKKKLDFCKMWIPSPMPTFCPK